MNRIYCSGLKNYTTDQGENPLRILVVGEYKSVDICMSEVNTANSVTNLLNAMKIPFVINFKDGYGRNTSDGWTGVVGQNSQ